MATIFLTEGNDDYTDPDGQSDKVFGLGGDDHIIGGDGNDTLDGGEGDDVLAGGDGRDSLIGGNGFDTADYSAASKAIKIKLDITDFQKTGGGGTDRLVSIEHVIGTAFGDNISGSGRLEGRGGDDKLTGGGGNDVLIGGDGFDRLDGGGGNDTADFSDLSYGINANILDGKGTVDGDTLTNIDNLVGTDFNDNLYVHNYNNYAASLQLFGGAGGDSLTTDNGNDLLDGGVGDDYLAAWSGNDTLFGRGGRDYLDGSYGNDFLTGGAGDDTIVGGDGTDTVSYAGATHGITFDAAITGPQDTGGAGVDTVSGIEIIEGSGQDDVLSGVSTIRGGGGDDILTLGATGGTLEGGAGADELNGAAGYNSVATYLASTAGVTIDMGNASAETGDAAGDTFHDITVVSASSYDDDIRGDDGNNSVLGIGGNDTWRFSRGSDLFDGGYGTDVADYSDATGPVNVLLDRDLAHVDKGGGAVDTLQNVEQFTGSGFADLMTGNQFSNSFDGSAGDDQIDGGAGADVVKGGDGADTLLGGADDDVMEGGAGADNLSGGGDADQLSGGDDDDTLSGGGGDDHLDGGAGQDRLAGGKGLDVLVADSTADTFVFVNAGDGADQIVGFQSGLHTIEIDASGFGAASMSFDLVQGSTPVASDSDPALLYDTDDGHLYLDPDGTGSANKVYVCQLIAPGSGVPALAYSDFVIV